MLIKSRLKKNKYLIFACLAVSMISFASISNADTYSYKWHYIDSYGLVHVSANGDNLSTDYTGNSNFEEGLHKWGYSAADITIT
jgi:hypothetical protein